MTKIEISLLNKNPVVNYLGGKFINPDEIVWLHENKALNKLDNVEKLLQSSHELKFSRYKIIPSNFDQVKQLAQKLQDKYKNEQVILNLSGDNQAIGHMVHDALQNFASQILIIDPDQNSIFNLTEEKSETIHTNLTVNEYIRLYGMKVRSGIHFDPAIGTRSRLTYFIGNNMNTIVPYLDNVGEIITRGNNTNTKWDLESQDINFSILKKDDQYQVKYGKNNDVNEIYLKQIGDEYLFRGEWLRELVFLRVNKSHFGDVRLNINLDPNSVPKKKKIETIIDVAMRRRCKFYIFQCFSYPVSRSSFAALSSISRTIEALDAESFILLSHRPPNSFIARAHSSGIKIVYGEKIANFSI